MRRLAQRLREHDWFAAAIELAIGVIGVIGILLALQVSNWNQSRLDARRAHAYLRRILADLETDLAVNRSRAQFMAQVGRYGQQALAHADTGALAGGSARKTVLAYYQAGQFYVLFARGQHVRRDARRRRPRPDPRPAAAQPAGVPLRIEREPDGGRDDQPQYRQDIRSVTPMPVQDYIWARCFRILPGSARDQRPIDCPPPVADAEAEARAILVAYAGFPELARELRFWLSNQRLAALNTPEDRRDALQLKAKVGRELQRL